MQSPSQNGEQQHGSLSCVSETDTLILRVHIEESGALDLPAREKLHEILERFPGITTVRPELTGETSGDGRVLSFFYQAQEIAKELEWDWVEDGLPDSLCRLLQLTRRSPEQKEAVRHGSDAGWVATTGERANRMAKGSLEAVQFTGECFRVMGRFVVGRSDLRWRDFWVQIQDVSVNALAIVSLISFLVGLIIAFLGAVVLARFAAEFYVSYLVGYGMLREMGALMVGVIMAGRTGAAYAAEIGTMKVNEEIDALKTFGISPFEFIVLPRILALIIIMPALTIYADAIGVLGGYLVSTWMLDIAPAQFFSGISTAVGMEDFLLGVFKGGVFGVLVAVSGCLRGMQCEKSAGGVGMAATSAVVTGITLIIIANAIIDWLAALYGI